MKNALPATNEERDSLSASAAYYRGQALVRRVRALQMTGAAKENTLRVADQFERQAEWLSEQVAKSLGY